MFKYIFAILVFLNSTFAIAGKYKISQPGKADVYVPTLESDGKTLRIKGRTNGQAVDVGDVGQTFEVNGADFTFTTIKDLDNYLTLPVGMWMISATVVGDSSVGATIMNAYWKIKGVSGTTVGKDYVVQTQVSTERGCANLPIRFVSITNSDVDKTIKLRVSNSISQSVYYYISAVRFI
jgi:hypothetical protein